MKIPEVARVTFSDSGSAVVSKFWIRVWSGIFSNLRIRLLFRLRQSSIQPKFNNVFT